MFKRKKMKGREDQRGEAQRVEPFRSHVLTCDMAKLLLPPLVPRPLPYSFSIDFIQPGDRHYIENVLIRLKDLTKREQEGTDVKWTSGPPPVPLCSRVKVNTL